MRPWILDHNPPSGDARLRADLGQLTGGLPTGSPIGYNLAGGGWMSPDRHEDDRGPGAVALGICFKRRPATAKVSKLYAPRARAIPARGATRARRPRHCRPAVPVQRRAEPAAQVVARGAVAVPARERQGLARARLLLRHSNGAGQRERGDDEKIDFHGRHVRPPRPMSTRRAAMLQPALVEGPATRRARGASAGPIRRDELPDIAEVARRQLRAHPRAIPRGLGNFGVA